MTTSEQDHDSDVSQAAAEWVVRLRGPDAGEDDWLAFETWLAGGQGRREAYDEAAALWDEFELAAGALKTLGGAPAAVIRLDDRRRPARAMIWTGLGATAAAAAAVAIFVLPQHAAPPTAAPPVVYVTARGERRAIVLPDGSRVELNGGSRMAVDFAGGARKVVLADAEASFAVAHDAQHPFLIGVGDRTVKVVGTQFDVLHHDGRIAVVVREGLVEVDDAGEAMKLGPGQRLRAVEGSPSEIVEQVTPQEAAGWRTGRLIYRDRPLSEVVSDLGRYFSGPIRLEGSRAAQMRFSGVLVVGREDEIISRIQDLLPVSVKRVNGATIISASEEDR